MTPPEKDTFLCGLALYLILASLVILLLGYCAPVRAAPPLVISVAERCLPIGIKGSKGGIDVYAKSVKVLRIADVCKTNPPARLWTDGTDRAVTCGNEPNPLTRTDPIQTVQFVRIGKC